MLNFLNGASTDDPIDNPLIFVSHIDGSSHFYVFFRDIDPEVHWQLFAGCESEQSIYNMINEKPDSRYKRQPFGRAKMCTVNLSEAGWDPYHHIFAQTRN